MSLEELSFFVNAIEHSQSLRTKLRKCNEYNEIIKLAKDYGFSISIEDFHEDTISEKAKAWFIKSRIYPIKR